MVLSRRVGALAASAVMTVGVAAPAVAVAGDYCPPPYPPPAKKHCNAGRGNGSEGCDPGNSSTSADGSTGQNMGGDEAVRSAAGLARPRAPRTNQTSRIGPPRAGLFAQPATEL
jgi:hypothetical protein